MSRFIAAACAALVATAGGLSPVVAQTGGAYPARQVVSLGTTPRLINLPRGSTFAVDLPTDARDVIVADPTVAESVLHSARRITVIGMKQGETDVVVLDGAGRTILSLRVRVDSGVSALQDSIGRIAPGAAVRAEAVNDRIILSGPVASAAEADRIQRVASAFVSTPENVINMMTIAGSDQVTLRVRVVEVQRNAVKQLGVNLNAIMADAGDGLSFENYGSFGISGGILGGGGIGYSDGTGEGLTANLRAFERVGLIRTLAEPNLTSVNGENASFLAGGEFPVPSGRDRDGGILITYKPIGVSLAFRPVVLSEGRISMQISVEVSELSNQGALTIGAGTPSAITLPGVNVRRTQNTVELPSGGSMMIAGLLQESTRQSLDAFPGLTQVPVVGALFRSRDYLMGETELVVIVEPYIVSPTSPGRMQTPADGMRIASDAQAIFFGQLNQAYGSPAADAPAGRWQGPVGYVIE